MQPYIWLIFYFLGIYIWTWHHFYLSNNGQFSDGPQARFSREVLQSSAIWAFQAFSTICERIIFVRSPEQLLNCLVSWESPGVYLMIDFSLGDSFDFFLASFAVLFCSVVLCCQNTHQFILPYCVVNGASFITGSVFECNIEHRRTMAVLCMLYNIRRKPMHPLHGAQPVPYVWVTHSACSPARCRTSQYRMTFIPLSVSPWNDINFCIRWCGTGGFYEQGQCFFYWPKLLTPF